MYNVDEDAGELTVFGYSNPLYFLEGRGLFRKLQAPHAYTITDAGAAAFQELLASGGISSDEVREVRVRAVEQKAMSNDG